MLQETRELDSGVETRLTARAGDGLPMRTVGWRELGYWMLLSDCLTCGVPCALDGFEPLETMDSIRVEYGIATRHVTCMLKFILIWQ
jgi:hypothetical protein